MDETRDARKYQTIRPQGTIAVKLSNNLLKPTTTFLVGLMLEKAVSYRQMQFFIHNLQCCCCRTRTNSGAYMLQFMSFRNCMTRYSYLLVVQRSPWSELHNFQNKKGELHQPRKAPWNIISYRLLQYVPNHLTTESQLWPMTSARTTKGMHQPYAGPVISNLNHTAFIIANTAWPDSWPCWLLVAN
jgi:hypothetical protein